MLNKILAADRFEMGLWVGRNAAESIRKAQEEFGHANLVVATGASQFEVLASLAEQPGIDWSQVTGFHLDEYVGVSPDHPASFCRYLRERFVDKVTPGAFHYLRGDEDAKETMQRVGELLRETRIDVSLVGIGENAHLAFNDPPADLTTQEPYLLVELDKRCRQQQVGEGWFPSMDEVPTHAISMSVQQILKSRKIFCSVPDAQKAEAVARTLSSFNDPMVPASALHTHPNATLIIDIASSTELDRDVRNSMESAS
ncbi:glucosamine-6-phosphate deaminase [Rhodopirellula sp. JC740]|uniref:Glucosamine-6-phosphate deaminase n=1 Tax=Rhodopirellula halodulae TaxID=2894198 RepID=A0ABS8NGR8_9BACT|nr:glucosamine-6-phosphate deaminase [Rhodopirellula sp. JC740]MCC9642142.1 glucosamine-6-phosphate deaminase [Rhodopirellula sp. JC740]